jgi:predicted permease
MSHIWQDLRYGVRMLTKRPGFTLIAILTLALGIGANTAIFSLVNTALLRPLPIAAPERLVALNNVAEHRLFATFSYPNYRDLRDRADVFEELLAYRFAPLSVSHDGVNERLWGYVVSGNYFAALGVRAALGRVITPEDDRHAGGHPVAVVSYRGWQTRFGGARDIVGREIIVNGRAFTIIGVAPSGFDGTEVIAAPELWFPMAMQAQIEVGNDWLEKRNVENIFVQGRLKPGVSLAQAQAALTALAQQLEREYPRDNEGKQIQIAPVGFMGGMMRGPALGFMGLLMGVVGLALLLACANLTNLLLARATERRREIAVRLALGASRLRIIRQLLTESLLLAGSGGLLGLFLASWLTDAAVRLKPPVDVPLLLELHIDYRVLLFTGVVAVLTGVLFGLLPAVQATGADLTPALKDEAFLGGYRRSWWKNGLLVAQVALSLALLIGGGLMLRALQRAQTLELGFKPQQAIELNFDLRLQGYDQARGQEFQKRLLERVRALPGVQAAGIADLVPVDLHFGSSPVFIEGQLPERDARAPRALANRVTPGYFGAMGTRLLEGREFTEQDNQNAPGVVIVNQAFARRFWPAENPLGKRFRLGASQAPPVEIIGIAEDGKYASLSEEGRAFVFRPLWQSYTGSSSLIVRATGEPQRLLATVRSELQQMDPHLPLSTARTMEEHLSLPLLPARVAAGVLGGFGLLALLLAAIGLYGVMSYLVAGRTREIGIRMALGAGRGAVLRMVLQQGLTLALLGAVLGLLASLALTRLMKSVLFGVSATDPLTFAAIALLLIGVAFIACYLPARRATQVDPIIALRHE